jgi:hypothetical protein
MNADQFQALLVTPAAIVTVSVSEFDALTDQYPWFGAAQFLSAVKKQKEQDADAEEQIQKAFLYFSEPLWMNFQLNRFENPISISPSVASVEEAISTDDSDALIDAEATIAAADAVEEVFENTTPLPTLLKHVVQPAKETGFSFEPYHTVDYFASQGIKLQEEKAATDKLGQQVKTFTQWLKSMKKINLEDQPQLTANDTIAIEKIASESNTEAEIITEAMATVLVQQGKTAKAIDLFGKLSLLHPEKSAYFASRIEELKL